MSPARSRRSASHVAGTHGWLPQGTRPSKVKSSSYLYGTNPPNWLPQKTERPGLRRGGVGGYNLHSVPPNSPPDCGTVAHQPRAGCIRLVRVQLFIRNVKSCANLRSEKIYNASVIQLREETLEYKHIELQSDVSTYVYYSHGK